MNILLTVFYNVLKTSKQEYMLNLTSSEKTVEMLFLFLQAVIGVHLHTYIILHGYFSLSKTNGLTMKAAGSEVLP